MFDTGSEHYETHQMRDYLQDTELRRMISLVALVHYDDDTDQTGLCNELAPFPFVLIFTVLPRNVTGIHRDCSLSSNTVGSCSRVKYFCQIFFNIPYQQSLWLQLMPVYLPTENAISGEFLLSPRIVLDIRSLSLSNKF